MNSSFGGTGDQHPVSAGALPPEGQRESADGFAPLVAVDKASPNVNETSTTPSADEDLNGRCRPAGMIGAP